MTDNVNVVFSISEKGFDKILRDVEALRSDLEGLGVDMSAVQARLDGIETSAVKAARGIKETASATRESTRSTKEEIAGLKERLRTIKQSSDAEYALNRQRKQSNRAQQIADFDAEYNALVKLTDAQNSVADPSARYALYDVAEAYTAIGAALAGVAVYAGVVGADFQSAFTNVARTADPLVATDEYLQNLRNTLVQLSGQAPLTFRELSEIATLGNQLGIAEDAVDGFTSTVARFSSVSGVSIEEVARAFGGIRAQTGLSEKYFENLGAAMALVSVRSNATEAQIISLTREIAAGANSAGFAIDEVVGLAGALASLQVAPERARGVLDTYFARLNKAVAEGGESLDAFSRVTGLAASEIDNLVRSGEGVTVFRSVLQGLKDNSNDVVELDRNLSDLGLTGLRASNTFLRFVNALGVADDSFANARQGFIEGAELNRQYAQTVDDLSSQFTILINGINALVDAVSGGGVESLAALLEVVNNVIFGFTEWVGNNKILAGIIGFALAVAGITGAMFLVRAGLVAATAATYAMRTAIASAGGTALAAAGTFSGLRGAIFGVKGATDAASGSLLTFRAVLRSVLASTGVGLLLVGLGFLIDGLSGSGTAANDAALSLDEYNEVARYTGLGSDGAAGGADNLADSLGGGGGKKGVADAAAEAAEKVRTLADYVSDLNGVFRRSEEIRFGSTAALDEITLRWIELNEQIAEYQSQIRSLTADRSLKAYFLGIAEAYDDQLRAGQLREEIAKIDEDLAKAQAGASTELTGNSKAAIENRKAFRGLLGDYEDYISALASAGASQEQIQAVISQLNSDFQAQATALGFNSGELITYTDRFQDLSTIIAQVPRNINVAFDGNPALLALNEFFAKAAEQARAAGQAAGDAFSDGVGGGIGGGLGDFDLGPRSLVEPKGRQSATAWWDGFLGFLEEVFVNFPTTVSEYVGNAIDNMVTEGNRLAGALWEGFVAWLQRTFSGFPQWITDLVIPAQTTASTSGGVIGGALGGGIASATKGTLDASNPVGQWVNNQNNSAYSNGDRIGRNYGGGIAAGLNAALGGKKVGVSFSRDGYSLGGFVDGFSGGGYTGAGHWLQPAGVVHRGEYVIPKKHVDQRTGLPDPNYVANLQRGRSAPKGGYATGGFVSGGGGPVDLSAGTINALLRGLSVSLNVGRERLAESASKGNERLSFIGSN